MARHVVRGRFNGLFPYGLSLARTKDKTSGGQALAAWLYAAADSPIFMSHTHQRLTRKSTLGAGGAGGSARLEKGTG